MIIVIGGGPAGRSAAIRLADGGREVRLIDSSGLSGGQCLHYGCMQVCALNDAARTLAQLKTLHKQNIFSSVPEISFPDLLAGMRGIQQKIASVLDRETRNSGVSVCMGKEAFISGDRVTVDGEEQESDAVIIATGSRPFIPGIEGIRLPGVFTPHTLKNMEKLPERLAIIGGGVTAAEFAYIFSTFGSAVEVICRSSFLPEMDRQIRVSAAKELKDVIIRENTTVECIRGDGKAESVVLKTGDVTIEREADAMLVATGLVPRTENVSGISKGNAGELLVDSAMQTGVKGVYAAGDVTGAPFLTPLARREGRVAADAILGRAIPYTPSCIPQTINLRYEHSFCSAPAEGVISYSAPSPAGSGSFWSVPERYTGTARVDIEERNGHIAGIYAGAPGTSAMTAWMAYFINNGIRVHDLEGFLEVHPATDGIYGIIRRASEKKGGRGELSF